jgi:hypothetical protein
MSVTDVEFLNDHKEIALGKYLEPEHLGKILTDSCIQAFIKRHLYSKKLCVVERGRTEVRRTKFGCLGSSLLSDSRLC